MAEDEAASGSQDQAAELAKQLQNPVASLISVLFQNNFDFNLGSHDDGFRYTLNFQPVIPMSLNKDYNLIIARSFQSSTDMMLSRRIRPRED